MLLTLLIALCLSYDVMSQKEPSPAPEPHNGGESANSSHDVDPISTAPGTALDTGDRIVNRPGYGRAREGNHSDVMWDLTSGDDGETKLVKTTKTCFMGTVKSVIDNFQKSINAHTNSSMFDLPLVQTYMEQARRLGAAEGKLLKEEETGDDLFTTDDFSRLKQQVNLDALKVDSVDEFKFDEAFNEIQDMVEKIYKANSHTTGTIQAWKRMINYNRYIGILSIEELKETDCVPLKYISLQALKDYTEDPYNENPKEICNPVETDFYEITPADLERHGIAFVFWSEVDNHLATEVNPGGQDGVSWTHTPEAQDLGDRELPGDSLFQAYNSVETTGKNLYMDIKYARDVTPNKMTIFIRILDKFYVQNIAPVSAEQLFGFVVFQVEPTDYKVTVVIRYACVEERIFVQTTAKTKDIENLTVNVRKPPCNYGPYVYPDVVYSHQLENTVIFETVSKIATQAEIDAVCPSTPHCDYMILDKCIICAEGYYYNPLTKLCERDCSTGYYKNIYTKECEPCDSECSVCSNFENCTFCAPGFYLTAVTLHDKVVHVCRPECNNGYYLSTELNECLPCKVGHCDVCSGDITCEFCTFPYMLVNNECVLQCPEGTYPVGYPPKCETCPYNCNCNIKGECPVCPENSYLFHHDCIPICPPGQYGYNGNCEPCKSECLECNSYDRCTICKNGFQQNSYGECIPICRPGETVSMGICVECSDPFCLMCSQNTNICDVCDPAHRILKGIKCEPSCGPGYYADTYRNVCVPCPHACDVCNAETCITCAYNYVLFQGMCLDACPEGYVNYNNTCVKCGNNCRYCDPTHPDTCTWCYPGEYLVNGICMPGWCGEGYVLMGDYCYPCSEGCQSCSNMHDCDKCLPNHILSGGICYPQCPYGTVQVGDKCMSCNTDHCVSCSIMNRDCKKCEENYFLHLSECVDRCPYGYFSTNDGICNRCPFGCSSCSSAGICDECIYPKVLENGICVNECQQNSFKGLDRCIPCFNNNCYSCAADLETCLTCPPGYFLYENNCISTCPSGYVNVGDRCEPCIEPCKSCSLTPFTCEVCIDHFYLTGKTCTDKCNVGEVFNPATGECRVCNLQFCDKCSIDMNSCIICKEGYRRHLNGCTKDCPSGTFLDAFGRCQPCLSNCRNCMNPYTCNDCEDNYLIQDDNTCVIKCSDGYIQINNKCVKCFGNCKTCKPDQLDFCITCPAGKYLLNGRCITSCPLQFFENYDKCTPCEQTNCLKCPVFGKCDKCKSGFILINGECKVRPCPDGTTEVNGRCVACRVSNCKICTSNYLTCDYCENNFYLTSQTTCEKDCPIGYYPILSTGKCGKCMDRCERCSNSYTCDRCKNNYFLKDGKCVEICGIGYNYDNSRCYPCKTPHCHTCDMDNCRVCMEGYVLINGICDTICLEGTYKKLIGESYQCVKCPAFCKRCTNGDTCEVCQDGYENENGICVDKCPNGLVRVHGKCETCETDHTCLKCAINRNDCVICSHGYYLKHGRCVPFCDEGYYSLNNDCLPCSTENCLSCENDTCVQCDPFYSLFNYHCLPTCPHGTYRDSTGRCNYCIVDGCDICSGEICDECRDGMFLYNNTCVSICMPGTYLALDGHCYPCISGCTECDNQYSCKVCKNGLYLYRGECQEVCPYHSLTTTQECRKCWDHCSYCPEKPEHCEICQDNYVLYNHRCYKTCPVGYYNIDGVCRACMDNCSMCSNYNSCDKCIYPYTFHPSTGHCVYYCPSGTTNIEGVCVPCIDTKGCDICRHGVETCDICNSSYFLYDHRCVDRCPNGYYPLPNTNKCRMCPLSCLSCQNEDYCTACAEGFTLDSNGRCVNVCDNGLITIDGECAPCLAKDCRSCAPGKPLICDECLNYRMVLPNGQITCVDTCPTGTYLLGKNCYPCSGDCDYCTDEDHCRKCKSPFALVKYPTGEYYCEATCHPGEIFMNGKCQECYDPLCNRCDGLNLNKCIECKYPYILQFDGTCANICPYGSWAVQISLNSYQCVTCGEGCIDCSGTDTCLHCEPGKFLLNGLCVERCPDGTIVNDQSQCERCTDTNCSVCSLYHYDRCEVCREGYYMTADYRCVKYCESGFYSNDLRPKRCISCLVSQCAICSPEDTCIECEQGTYLLNGQCVPHCPYGYRQDMLNGVCVRCKDKRCRECNNEYGTCTKCQDLWFIYQDECVFTCPTGFYKRGLYCVRCPEGCLTCTSQYTCETCLDNFYLEKHMCINICGEGKVSINGICHDCHDPINCLVCGMDSTCVTCHYPKLLINGECVDTCPPYSYKLGNECVVCDPNKMCLECYDEKTCNKCPYGTIYMNGYCVNECPEGHYNYNGECHICDIRHCKYCSNSNQCEQCLEPYRLINNQCKTYCDVGHRWDEVLKRCVSCPGHCKNCENGPCDECELPWALYNENCYDLCPEGYFMDMSVLPYRCLLCSNPSCFKCDGTLRDECTECPPGQFIYTNQFGKKDCGTFCPPYTFTNPVTGACESCPSYCKRCDINGCLECENNLTLRNGICDDTCPDGFVMNALRICEKCQDTLCRKCYSDVNRCDDCLSPYFLFGNVCVDSCFDGYMYDHARHTCVPCPHNCSRCKEGKCIECSEGYFFKPNSYDCMPCNAPDIIDNGICKVCQVPDCIKCSQGLYGPVSEYICEICGQNTILHEGKCITICPPGFYNFGGICRYCNSRCKTCTGENFCLTCQPGFVLIDGECKEKCQDGYSMIGSNCEKCPDHCLRCPHNANECDICYDGYGLFDKKCLNPCPEGTVKILGKCVGCQKGCKLCNDQGCIKCEADQIIKGDYCVDKCKEGEVEVYINNKRYCEPCRDQFCDQCNTNPEICDVCKLNFVLRHDNTCHPKCATNEYYDPVSGYCILCPLGCKQCTDHNNCTVCYENSFLYNGMCVNPCPPNFTNVNNYCVPCGYDDRCSQCVSGLPDRCDTCLHPYVLFDGSCLDKCPDGYFEMNGMCYRCHHTCETCSGYSHCDICLPPLRQIGDECVNVCPDGQVSVEGGCKPCDTPNCKTCKIDLSECIYCEEGFFLYNGMCISICRDGSYPVDGECYECGFRCKKCKEHDKCDECYPGYFLKDGVCVTNCEDGYGDCKLNECKDCFESCKSCHGPQNGDCTECKLGYYKHDKFCYDQNSCPMKTYPDAQTGECVSCKLFACEECGSNNGCKKCFKGYKLDENGQCSPTGSVESIVSHKVVVTYSKYKEANYSLSEHNGIGVKTPSVHFDFLLRVLSPLNSNDITDLFQARSNNNFVINLVVNTQGQCELSLRSPGEDIPTSLNLGPCDFNKLSKWTRFGLSFTYDPEKKTLDVDAEIDGQVHSNQIKNNKLLNGILDDEAAIRFGASDSKEFQPSSLELTQFYVFNYIPEKSQLSNIRREPLPETDYYCKMSGNDCKECSNGQIDSNGHCPSTPIYVKSGLTILKGESELIDLSDVETHLLSSSNWGMSFNFIIQSTTSDITKLVKLGVNYGMPQPTLFLTLIYNKKDSSLGFIHPTGVQAYFSNIFINQETWYNMLIFVRDDKWGVNLREIHNTSSGYSLVQLAAKPPMQQELPSENGPFARLHQNVVLQFFEDGVLGAIHDVAVYFNNVEASPATLQGIEHCVKYKIDNTCSQCSESYSLNPQGICVLDALKNEELFIDRISLWNGEEIWKDFSTLVDTNFSLSLFVRKRTHTLISNRNTKQTYDLVRIVTSSRAEVKAVSIEFRGETNDNLTRDMLTAITTMTRAEVVFDEPESNFPYIGIVLSYDKATNKMTVYMKDHSNSNSDLIQQTIDFTFDTSIQGLTLGNADNHEVRSELSMIKLYRSNLDEDAARTALDKLPIDCDPGCVEGCDLTNGHCQRCKFGDLINDKSCIATLVGFQNSYFNFEDYNDAGNYDGYKNSMTKSETGLAMNSSYYSFVAQVNLFRIDNIKSGQRARILSLGNDRNTSEEIGRAIIYVDVVNTRGELNFEVTVNNGRTPYTELINNVLVLQNKYYLIHAGIRVDKKEFKIQIKGYENASGYEKYTRLQSYPERLNESSVIKLFGVNDHLTADYVPPHAIVHNGFAIINLPFNSGVVLNYSNKPVDPTGMEGCRNAAYTNVNSVKCLACEAEYDLNNGECEKRIKRLYSYLGMIDKPTTIAQKPLDSASELDFSNDYTVNLFFRLSSIPHESGDIKIMIGALNIYVSLNSQQDTCLLTVGKVSVTMDTIQLYEWTLINFIKIGNELRLNLYDYSEPTIPISKTITPVTGDIYDNLNIIDFPNGSVQIYGFQLIDMANQGFIGNWPQFDCGINCLHCVRNQCLATTIGRDENNVPFADSIVVKGSAALSKDSIQIKELFPNDGKTRNIRTHTFSLEFIMFTLRTYEDEREIIALENTPNKFFSLTGRKDLKNFYGRITYQGRFFKTYIHDFTIDLSFSMEDPEYLNTYMYFGLNFTQDNIEIFFYNTVNRQVTYNIPLQSDIMIPNRKGQVYGAGDYLNNETIIMLSSKELLHDVNLTVDGKENLSMRGRRLIKLSQKNCWVGDRYTCQLCVNDRDTVSGICVDNTEETYASNVISIQRVSDFSTEDPNLEKSNQVSIRYFLVKQLKDFSFGFWFRFDGLTGLNQGILRVVGHKETGQGKEEMDIFQLWATHSSELHYRFTFGGSRYESTIQGPEKEYDWAYFHLNWESNTLQIKTYDSSHRSIQNLSPWVENVEDSEPQTFAENKLYFVFGFDKEKSEGEKQEHIYDNVSLSFSKLLFSTTPDSRPDESMTTPPLECNSLCTEKCEYGECTSSSKSSPSIEINSLLANLSADSQRSLMDEANKYPLFKELDSTRKYFPSSFTNYLIAFEFTVDSFLSNKYAVEPNNNILLLLTNNKLADLTDKTLNDSMEAVLTDHGILAIQYDEGNLYLKKSRFSGSLVSENIEIPLGGRDIHEYTKIYISMAVHPDYIRIIVVADDLIFTLSPKFSSPIENLSTDTLSYSHPAISTVKVVFQDPRIDQGWFIKAINDKPLNNHQKFCERSQPNCSKCIVPEGSTENYCMQCKEGFVNFDGSCKEAAQHNNQIDHHNSHYGNHNIHDDDPNMSDLE